MLQRGRVRLVDCSVLPQDRAHSGITKDLWISKFTLIEVRDSRPEKNKIVPIRDGKTWKTSLFRQLIRLWQKSEPQGSGGGGGRWEG